MTAPGYLTNAERERLLAEHPHLEEDICPTCRGKETFRWQGADVDCICSEQKRLHRRYLHAGIGTTYQRLSWADVHFDLVNSPVTDYLDNIEDYVARGMGLLLHGPVGTGKTLVANLMAKELVKKGYDTFVATFASTVEHFTATWGDNEEKKVFAKRFMQSQMLVLDDLGKEYKSSNRLSPTTFDHILRTRVQGGRPTILTTNMIARELQGGYGGAVLSLLVEQSIEVELKGDDFRPTANLRTKDEIAAHEIRPII